MSHLSEDQLDQIVAEERRREQTPLNEWRTIAARAREEGLIRESQPRSWVADRPWIQAAAAVLLLVGGITIGRTTTGLPSVNGDGQVATQIGLTTDRASMSSAAPTASGATFTSVDEASTTLERALTDYQRASAFLAENSSGPTTRDSTKIYMARLAALDTMGSAMESALRTAPHDPVINQYYLATMGARVATQQMVSQPVGLKLKGF
jgi:hypothetical protein